MDRVTVGSFTTENRVKLLRLIASLTPEGLNRTQLYSGGAEAVEAAIRLAKSYTKKYEILSFWGGFHGKTGGVLGLIGDPIQEELGHPAPGPAPGALRRLLPLPVQDGIPRVRHVLPGFRPEDHREQHRGQPGRHHRGTHSGDRRKRDTPSRIPARPGPRSPGKNDALLIADEMITGFGRTGKMFGVEHTGIIPDIMTIGKGLGSGFPVSGLVSTDVVTGSMPFSKPSSSSSSFGGNPLAATAALVSIQTILDESLVENSRQVGEHLLNGLRGLQEKYPFIGDVRGRGLLIGVELVKDRKTREPLDKPVTKQLFLETVKRGLISMNYKANFRINPPLVLSREEADEGLAILDEAFALLGNQIPYK